VAPFISTDEQLEKNRGCCFLVQALLPEGFPFYQFNIGFAVLRCTEEATHRWHMATYILYLCPGNCPLHLDMNSPTCPPGLSFILL